MNVNDRPFNSDFYTNLQKAAIEWNARHAPNVPEFLDTIGQQYLGYDYYHDNEADDKRIRYKIASDVHVESGQQPDKYNIWPYDTYIV